MEALPLILQVCTFLAVTAALLFAYRNRYGAYGKKALTTTILAFALAACSAGMSLGMLFQEKTGLSLGLPGGVVSDAEKWLKQHEGVSPRPGQVGDNMAIFREGMAFLKTHKRVLPPTAIKTMETFSTLPEKPVKLLSPTEEQRYYAAADEIMVAIRGLARPDGSVK